MSVNLEIREKLPKDAMVFDDYAYDNSIIGVTLDGRVIYDYYRMIYELKTENDLSYEDAVDWIDYNTVRSLSYIDGKKPMIVSDEDWYSSEYEEDNEYEED